MIKLNLQLKFVQELNVSLIHLFMLQINRPKVTPFVHDIEKVNQEIQNRIHNFFYRRFLHN